MSIYAIGDLHLSGAMSKPMDIFGEEWKNHHQKIKKNWLKKINENDTVLIPGDISWAMKMEDAKVDLDFIADLPGKKIFIKGNHDYWWNSIGKLNSMYDNMTFLQNSFVALGDYAICGTRGWDMPSEKFTPADFKTYNRELMRMKNSLDQAVNDGYSKIIFMFHYPPLYNGMKDSDFVNIIGEYPVEEVVYGHLHGKENFVVGAKGKIGSCNYRLVSADYLDFDPILIK